MTIVLPENKCVAYSKAIPEMLLQGWISSRERGTPEDGSILDK
jgi:hypothetical protein